MATPYGASDGQIYHLDSPHTSDGTQRKYAIEFQAGPFKHNTIALLQFITCLLPIIALCGTFTLTVLFVGLIAAWILDFLNYKNWTLLIFWATMGSVQLALYFGHSVLILQSWLNLFIFLNASFFILLSGVWGTVQFRWFQVRSPNIALVAERVLVGVVPFTVLPLHFTTIVGFAGVVNSPFWLAAVLCITHKACYTLRKSSWKVALVNTKKNEENIQGKFECMLYTLVMCFAPALMYYMINHRVLVFDVYHILNILALLDIPCYYIMWNPGEHLWWLFSEEYRRASPSEQKEYFLNRTWVQRPALIALHLEMIFVFQYRVLHSHYGHLMLGVAPPMNAVLLFFACVSASILIYLILSLNKAYKLGKPSEDTNWKIAGNWVGILFIGLISGTCFGLVVGLPNPIIPFPALSVACLAAYCLDRNNVNNFFMFAVCSSIVLMWWIFKNFGFLEMDMAILLASNYIGIGQVSALLLLLFAVSCLVFVLSFYAHGEALEGTMLLTVALFVHCCLFSFVEHVLYSQAEVVYPGFLVVVTSAVGVGMCFKMHKNEKLRRAQCCGIVAAYLSKLLVFLSVVCADDEWDTMGVEDETMHQNIILMSFLSMFISSLVCCYILCSEYMKKQATQAGTLQSSGQPTRTAIVYLSASFVLLVMLRNNVLTSVLRVTSVGLYTATNMSVTRLWGVLIFVWGLLQLPISLNYIRHLQWYKSVNIGLLVVGAVVALVQPALDIISEMDTSVDSDIFLYQPPSWAGWLGATGLILVGCTLAGVVNFPHHSALRYVWWGSLTTVLSSAYCAAFLPYAGWNAYISTVVLFGSLGLIIEFAHFPLKRGAGGAAGGGNASQYMPCVALFAVHFLTVVWLTATVGFADFGSVTQITYVLAELQQVTQTSLIALFACANLFMAVLLRAKLSGKPLIRSAYSGQANSQHFLYTSAKALMPLGLVLNCSTLMAFFCLALFNILYNESSVSGFFGIAGVLLLLGQDDYLFQEYTDRHRYVPPLLFLETLMSLMAIVQMFSTYSNGYVLRNLIMFGFGLPAHFVIWRFINVWKAPKPVHGMVALFLAVVSISFSTLPAIRWLGLSGCTGICGAFFTYTLWSKQSENLL